MSNKETIGKVIGAYWPEIVGDYLDTLIQAHASFSDDAERSMTNLKESFSEATARDELGVYTVAFDIPTTSIAPIAANGRDSSALYGDGLFSEQLADDAGWTIALPEPLPYKPFITTAVGEDVALIEGVDYVSTGIKTLDLYVSPYTHGFTRGMTVDETGTPVMTLRMVFPMSGDIPGGYVMRYGFYRVPEIARREVFDLIALEGSTRRLLAALSAAIGIKGPTVFDKTDMGGSYTSVLKYWVDGEYAYGLTSGGELIKAPLAYAPSFTHGSALDGGDSMIGLVGVYDRISDSPITGQWFRPERTNGLVVLNDSVPLGNVEDSLGGENGYHPSFNLQIRGSTKDKDYYYRHLADRLATVGKTMADVFPEGAGNPVELLYDGLGRKQPPVLSIENLAATDMTKVSALFKACVDNVPAGSGLIISTSSSMSEIFTPSIEDEVTPFILYDVTDTAPLSKSIGEATSKGTVLS